MFFLVVRRGGVGGGCVLHRPSRRAPPKFSLGSWPIACKGPSTRAADVKLAVETKAEPIVGLGVTKIGARLSSNLRGAYALHTAAQASALRGAVLIDHTLNAAQFLARKRCQRARKQPASAGQPIHQAAKRAPA